MNKKKSTQHRGFTLLEMLISVAVFVVIATIALGTYTSIIRANRKSAALTRLHKDAQVIMLALAKKIRQSNVDYDYYGGPIATDGSADLALIDADGTSYVFSLESNNSTIQVEVDGDSPVSIPAGEVMITDLKFFILPITDPFLVVPDEQPEFPRVTVVMRLEPRNQSGMYSSFLIVQQTIPQRGGGY